MRRKFSSITSSNITGIQQNMDEPVGYNVLIDLYETMNFFICWLVHTYAIYTFGHFHCSLKSMNLPTQSIVYIQIVATDC